MERAKKPIKDKEQASLFEHIYRNALGNPIILDETPAKDDMKANTIAKNGSDIYIKTADNRLIKLTGTEIT